MVLSLSVLFSAIKSARFRPVRERGDMSPPPQSKADPPHSRLKSREGIPHITSPRTHRQARGLLKDEGDKEREQTDKNPAAAQEVIYF